MEELFEESGVNPPNYDEIPIDYTGMWICELEINGDNKTDPTPVPKQSTRFFALRHRSDGFHTDPYTGVTTKHKKGDVLIYKNKNGCVDINMAAYTESSLVKEEKKYKEIFLAQALEQEHQIYTEEVHILKIHFIFPYLQSFSAKKIKEINKGNYIEFKTTKPDMHDNLKKMLIDSMAGIIFSEDSRICSETNIKKFYGPNPGTYITLIGR